MSRTTLDIQDELLKAAKSKAAGEGKTLTSIVEESLQEYVFAPARPAGKVMKRWITVQGKRTPDIDIADRDRLYDLMDGR